MLFLRAPRQELSDHAGRYGLMELQKLRRRKALAVEMRGDEVLRQRVEAILVSAQQPARTRDGIGKGGIELPQHGRDGVADAVAAVIVKLVRAVLDVGRAACGEVFHDLRAGEEKQRADDPSPPRRDAAEALRPGPAGKVEEHGLGVVVGVVGGGDEVEALFLRRFFQEGVAQSARRLLEPLARFPGQGRDVGVPGEAGDAPFAAVRLDEGAVAQALRAADAVLEVRGGDLIVARPAQQREQTHRVRPAGHGAEHARALRREDQLFLRLRLHRRGIFRRNRSWCIPAPR